MSSNLRGYMYAALSSASYGVNAFAVLLYACGLTTNSVLFYRYFFASLIMGCILLVKREGFKLTLKELALVLPHGHAIRLLIMVTL